MDMCNGKRWIEKFFLVSILLISLLITPNSLFGGEADKKSEVDSKRRADFVITIKDSLISLTAKDASLKQIVEEIGRRMKIEVVADISEEEKITTKFDKLSLEDAIKKLRTSYAYVWNSEKEEGKITKIVLLPEGKGTVLSRPTNRESEVKGEKRLVRSESSARKKIASEKSPRPEPFKFEFDPSEFMEEGQ
jgi:type II secretory pathway component GspD/PulD (secretin)